MTIECYYSLCPYHRNNSLPPDEGPFCYQEECIASEENLSRYAMYRVVSLADNEKLASWWCAINIFEWPEELAQFKDKVEPIEIMSFISLTVGYKACLREWNKERMNDEKFEQWWKNKSGVESHD